MYEAEKEFIDTFNENYPFERYIFKEPKKINSLFDDLLLTELFIPCTEIKPITDDNGKLITHTSVPTDEIYVKCKVNGNEFRLSYFDFASHIREDIRWDMVQEFGQYEWECLYVENDGEDDLKDALQIQKNKIIEKYGICECKSSCHITDVINLVNTLE